MRLALATTMCECRICAHVAVISIQLVAVITSVQGQCTSVRISGAKFSSTNGLNGDYFLNSLVLCNKQDVWEQQQNTGDGESTSAGPNYIFYSAALQTTNSSQMYRWVVGVELCEIVQTMNAIQLPGNYSQPYDVPEGHWQELVAQNNSLVTSQNMTCLCSSGDGRSVTLWLIVLLLALCRTIGCPL